MMIINKIKLLTNNKEFLRYFSNTSWLLGEKLLRLTLGVFIGIWIARYLGPERFGIFNYVQSYVALFTAIATLGLDNIIVRELVKSQSARDELLGTAFVLKLIGAVVTLVLLGMTLWLQTSDSQTTLYVYIIASTTIFQSFNVIDFYFQSKVLSKFVVFSNIISLLISSIIKLFLILNDAPLIAFFYVVLFDSLILSLGFIFFYFYNRLSFLNWSFNKNLAIVLLKDSWPLILSGIIVSIYIKIDQVMLKEMIGNEAVGVYAAAVRLSEVWYFIPVVICSSLFPALIDARKQSENLYYDRLQTIYSLMSFIAIIIALSMTFLSNWLIHLLYGVEYYQAGKVLMIHIWAGIFVFIGVASGKWLLVENLQIISIVNTAFGAIVNIVLNYIFIKKIGVEGAAWATLVSYFLAAYLSLCFWKKTRINFINISKSLLFIKSLNIKRNN